MAKETVQIVFSADSQQARALFAEIERGQNRVSKATKEADESLESLSTTYDFVSRAADVYGRILSVNIEKQREFNRLARARAEGGQSLAIEGGLSSRQEAAVNANIDSVAIRRAAPNREFVRQLAEEMLQVGMTPDQITGGGLESGVKILQGFNEAKPGGNGTTMMRQLIANMQNMGIAVTPQNMERAAVQFNEIKQLTGLEFGPASNILEGMARIGKSPRRVKALAGIGLTPEQIDPAKAGIPGAMQALFGATSGMGENQRSAMFARLFGGDEATGLARMYARRGEMTGGDYAGFERDAARAVQGPAALARAADTRLEAAGAAAGDAEIEALLTNAEAIDTNAGYSPFMTGLRSKLRRGLTGIIGNEKALPSLLEEFEKNNLPQKIQLELPNKTRVPGVIKATENLEGMLKSAAGAGGGLN